MKWIPAKKASKSRPLLVCTKKEICLAIKSDNGFLRCQLEVIEDVHGLSWILRFQPNDVIEGVSYVAHIDLKEIPRGEGNLSDS